MSSDDDAAPTAAEAAGDTHLLGFSDEILLHILSHVPSTDLVLNVRRTCRKLAALCLDKSLVHTVLLQKDYQVRQVWVGSQDRPRCQPVGAGGNDVCTENCVPGNGHTLGYSDRARFEKGR